VKKLFKAEPARNSVHGPMTPDVFQLERQASPVALQSQPESNRPLRQESEEKSGDPVPPTNTEETIHVRQSGQGLTKKTVRPSTPRASARLLRPMNASQIDPVLPPPVRPASPPDDGLQGSSSENDTGRPDVLRSGETDDEEQRLRHGARTGRLRQRSIKDREIRIATDPAIPSPVHLANKIHDTGLSPTFGLADLDDIVDAPTPGTESDGWLTWLMPVLGVICTLSVFFGIPGLRRCMRRRFRCP